MRAFLLLLLVSPEVFSASLFSEETPINIVLSGNISNNIEHRKVEQNRYGKIRISIDGQAFVGQMKVRGNSRATQCDIPPLKLKISEKNPYFKKNKVYKIVSHCNDKEMVEKRLSVGSEIPIAGDNYLLKEYLSYKIQSLIMPNRYQVRLLKITYIDDNKIIPEITRYGFVLERSKRLAKRLNAKHLQGLTVVKPEKLLLEELVWVSYFNLLIGNQDYTLWAKASHNFDFFEQSDGIIAVPYDFDLSELMNRKERAEGLYYNMYTHITQFPCGKSNEETFRRVGKELFLKKEKILQYLDEFTIVTNEIRENFRSLLAVKFEQLQNVVMNKQAIFKKEKVSWSPGYCTISFRLPATDPEA